MPFIYGGISKGIQLNPYIHKCAYYLPSVQFFELGSHDLE